MSEQIIKSPFYILFVDDEDNARKYFDKGLKHYFNIFTAANVEEAIKIIDDNHQDIAVVITDQRMPGGNGVKLLRFLRETHPRIIRLLTTAYSDLSEAIDAVNGGEIFRYIQKPWDFNLLKTELKQAMELFELRFEHRKLLQEKIMVKRKISRIERSKSLILFAQSLNFLRFSDVAVQNFIKKFAISSDEKNNDEDWESFDFGNGDVLEIKFFLEIISRINAELPFSKDYSINEKFDSNKIIQILGQQNNAKISDNISILVNNFSFDLLLKKISKIGQELVFSKIENQIVINFKLSDSSNQIGNIFSQNPAKALESKDLDLLTCYLISSHHGGFVELTKGDLEINCTIKLSESGQIILSSTQPDSLENTILTTMIC